MGKKRKRILMPLSEQTRKSLETVNGLVSQLETIEKSIKTATAAFLTDDIASVPQHQIVNQLLQSSANVRNAIAQIQAAATQSAQL